MECEFGPIAERQCHIKVWDEETQQHKTLICGEKLYNALIKAAEELKEKTGYTQTPYVIIRSKKGYQAEDTKI